MSFEDRLTNLDTPELLAMHQKGGYLPDGFEAIEAELASRGENIPPRPSEPGTSNSAKIPRWVYLIVFIFFWVGWNAFYGGGKQARLEESVNQAMEEASREAFAKFLNGEHLESVDLLLALPKIEQNENNKLPKLVTEHIQLNNFHVESGKATYKYTILTYTQKDQESITLASHSNSWSCSNRIDRALLSANVNITHIFYSPEGELIYRTEIAPRDCRPKLDIIDPFDNS